MSRRIYQTGSTLCLRTLDDVKAVPIAPAIEPNRLEDLDEAEATVAGRSGLSSLELIDCLEDDDDDELLLRWESRLTLTGCTSAYCCDINGSHLKA